MGSGRWRGALIWCTVLSLTLALGGCTGTSGPSATSRRATHPTPAAAKAREARPAPTGHITVHAANADRCDPISIRGCLFPFPNDHFTRRDASSATGRRIAFARASMPADAKGKTIDPREWNRNDGFSPGQAILVQAPGVDLRRSGAAPITDIASSLDDDAPIAVFDVQSGQRWPYWVEMDTSAQRKGEDDPAMIIRPARNWVEGDRYVVGIRRLSDHQGHALRATEAFRAYRDNLGTGDRTLEARRPAMNRVFGDLAKAGVASTDLFLAWDFTVASSRNLTERMLSIRDNAFGGLGKDAAPPFRVVPSTDTADGAAKVVDGTFEVPLYLTEGGVSGSRFRYASTHPGPGDLPVRRGTYTAKFQCVLPTHQGPEGEKAHAIVYGHGLLGDRGEVLGFGGFAQQHNAVLCATDWIGLAEDDIANAAAILQDLSKFPTLADRVQQGYLNTLYLARLLRSPEGLATDPAFAIDGQPIFATGNVTYWGRSQGGIFGGGATAVSTEWTRAVLGQPGINYSTLLSRSVDFDDFAPVQEKAYPDLEVRPLLAGLIQMLWDRAEGNGYAAHMTDQPLPGTPAHQVLLFEAYGDHQVANIATEVEARTIGARLREPALAAGRSPDKQPFWGIERIASLPYTVPEGGSVLVLWDFGTPTPPLANVPPRGKHYGDDPHDMDADTPRALDLVDTFLTDGRLVDVCAPGPCDDKPVSQPGG